MKRKTKRVKAPLEAEEEADVTGDRRGSGCHNNAHGFGYTGSLEEEVVKPQTSSKTTPMTNITTQGSTSSLSPHWE